MKPLVCLATVALFAGIAAAQAPLADGVVEGVVSDPQPAVIVNAEVTFSDPLTHASRSVQTDNNGRYRALVPPGPYDVRVEAPWFRSSTRRVSVREGETLQLDFVLEVASSGEDFGPYGLDEIVIPPIASSASIPEIHPTPGISVIHFVAPKYPPLARTARIQGDVRLLVEVAPDGTSKSVSVLSGHPMLSPAAMEAVKQWRFGCQRCSQPLTHIVTISFLVAEDLAPDARVVEPNLPAHVLVKTGTEGITCGYGEKITTIRVSTIISDIPAAGQRLESSPRPKTRR